MPVIGSGGVAKRPRFFLGSGNSGLRGIVVIVLCLAFTGPAAAGRLIPPKSLKCDINRLTSHTGIVSSYTHEPKSTRIEITTNWGSVERFTLSHTDGRPESHYLLWGEPFQAEDWDQIVSANGELRESINAIAWVCRDEAIPPVIDWRPGAKF